MTAGGFEFSRNGVEQGSLIRVHVNYWGGFGDKVLWRLVGNFDNDVIIGKTAGVIRFKDATPGTRSLKIKTARIGSNAKVGIEMSTDPAFRDPTVGFNVPSNSPLFIEVYKNRQKDLLTGTWTSYVPRDSFIEKRYPGHYSLVVSKGSATFDRYYMALKQRDIDRAGLGLLPKKISVFADNNFNLMFDKADNLVGRLKGLRFFSIAGQADAGSWKADSLNNSFTQSAGGQVMMSGLQDFL
jgi:hypothetical protein